MFAKLTTVSVAALFALSATTPGNASPTPTPAPRVTHGWDQSHRPCQMEDGPGPCFWNADSRDNQMGRDFHMDRANRVYYVTHDMIDSNHVRHDACWLHVADTSRVWCEDGFRSVS